MRAVRLADSAKEDIDRQLPADRATDFRHHDLRPVLEASSPHEAGRRLTIDGRTVAGFHLFGVPDTDDPRDDAILIYHIVIKHRKDMEQRHGLGFMLGMPAAGTVSWQVVIACFQKETLAHQIESDEPLRRDRAVDQLSDDGFERSILDPYRPPHRCEELSGDVGLVIQVRPRRIIRK